MKDLDFDELDRAVNSLSASIPVSNDGNTNDVSAGSVAVPVTAAPVPSQPTPSRPNSGHFMDVVHPSSDMRKMPLMTPQRTPKEEAVSTNTVVPEPPVVVAPDPIPVPEPIPVSEPVQEPIPEPTPALAPTPVTVATTMPAPLESPPKASVWPDPIDFKVPAEKVNDNAEKASQIQDEDADIDQISKDIDKLSQTSEGSLDSPFISGTKVEKRPLGAFSDGSTVQTFEPTEQGVAKDTDDVATATQADEVDVPLPDELSDGLLKIESSTATSVDEPVVDTAEAVEESESAQVAATPAVESQPVAAASPVSITQQYKEQPSSGDKETGAIYDTDSYHKPLAFPAKKKPGLSWVLWIVLLLVVSVGAGVAVYKFVLPNL